MENHKIPDTPLAKIIRQKIRENGAMPLSEYISLCLGHPEYGYYMSRDPFGKDGDFITAPEVSQMFGEVIGAWLIDTWQKMGSPKDVTLLEFGGGRGTLMSDVLRVAKNVPEFITAVHVQMIETSPVLRGLQEKSLEVHDLKNAPKWGSSIESVVSKFPVIAIGNEFLDALPVDQLTFTDAGWSKKFIELEKDDTFRIRQKLEYRGRHELENAIPNTLFKPKLGDIVEVSLEQRRFNNDLMKIVLNQGGIIIWIDYGFKNGVGDTVQAVKKHSFSDIFDAPGENDITYHVNFADLAEQAMSKNLTVHGPVSQGEYLSRLGIKQRAEKLKQHATNVQRSDIDAALNRLVGKDQMGDLFKVISFSSDPNIDLAGF